MDKAIIVKSIEELISIGKTKLAKKLLDECCESHMSWAGSWHPDTSYNEGIIWESIYEKFGFTPNEILYEYI